MGNCPGEDYIFFLQELLNGVRGVVRIRDSTGGYYSNEDENNRGQEPCFPTLHQKEEQQYTETECQDKENDRLRKEVVPYHNATDETEYKLKKRTIKKSLGACALFRDGY